jgi:2-polyprenyl-3-methyl-5-hydroxy-6-metoxy-1,4-benzoquinol methylase
MNWEDESVAQWHSEDRSSPEKIVDFFQTQTSWIFDTMWYHAEQWQRKAFPQSVEIAYELQNLPIGNHLDFGAGPGTSSLFFYALGWKVALADISTSFQEFAKWRLKQHKVPADFYNTSSDRLPLKAFDLITAFDVMAHIPDIYEALVDLNLALRPNGYLIFNIDSRTPNDPRTEYHFFDEHYLITRYLGATGFRQRGKIHDFYVYQKISRSPICLALAIIYDQLRYNWLTCTIAKLIRKLKFMLKSIISKRKLDFIHLRYL